MSRLCVVCREPMKQEIVLDIQVDTCQTCAGVWFDKDELKQLQQKDELAFLVLEDRFLPRLHSVTERAKELRCPDCDALLTPFQYMYDSPIQLDICDLCSGVWVDDGELKKMYQCNHAPMTTTEEHRIALADYEHEHDETVLRSENIRRFCSLYRRFFPRHLP